MRNHRSALVLNETYLEFIFYCGKENGHPFFVFEFFRLLTVLC